MASRVFFELSKNEIGKYCAELYQKLANCAKVVPKFQWIFVGMNMDAVQDERCIDKHMSNIATRDRPEEKDITREYMDLLYQQYKQFISIDLRNVEKWIIDCAPDVTSTCKQVMNALQIKEM